MPTPRTPTPSSASLFAHAPSYPTWPSCAACLGGWTGAGRVALRNQAGGVTACMTSGRGAFLSLSIKEAAWLAQLVERTLRGYEFRPKANGHRPKSRPLWRRIARALLQEVRARDDSQAEALAWQAAEGLAEHEARWTAAYGPAGTGWPVSPSGCVGSLPPQKFPVAAVTAEPIRYALHVPSIALDLPRVMMPTAVSSCGHLNGRQSGGRSTTGSAKRLSSFVNTCRTKRPGVPGATSSSSMRAAGSAKSMRLS